MTNYRGLKKIIAIIVLGAFFFQVNICLHAQSEDEIVKQFQRAKNSYLKGNYENARIRLETIISIITESNITRNDILGKCYLLLGAIYEKKDKPKLAEENYRKANNTLDNLLVDKGDMDSLPLYRKIVKGTEPPTKGVIEKVKIVKPGKKKFPWLLVVGGTVAAGLVLYFLVLKPPKKSLQVILDDGVEGTPAPGIHRFKKGEVVNYNYRARDGYSHLKVFLDDKEYGDYPAGMVKMDKDYRLSVTTDRNEVNFITDKDEIEINEGNEALLNIQLSAQPQDYVNVMVTHIQGDNDIVVLGEGNLTFTPDNWGKFQTVVLKAKNDADAENDQAVFRISAPASGITAKDITVTEIDKTNLNFVTNTDNVLIDEGKTAHFTVRLSAKPSANVVTNINRVSGDKDIIVKAGSQLTFSPHNWDTPQTVTLSALEDKDSANSEAFIRISAPGTTIAPKEIIATELDNEGLNFFIDTDEVIINEGQTASFNVKLLAQPAAEISASVTPISGDKDITVQSGSTLTFTPNNWNNPHRVTLKAEEDTDTLNGQTTLRISASGLTPKYITATENDNDHLEFIVTPGEVSIDEGGTASFNVKLSAQPAENISAAVTRSAGDSDITVQSGSTLTFNPTDWDTQQTVTLQAARDEDEENGETQISITADGMPTQTITARENDNYRGQPPEISISSPTNGETLSKNITIKAIANDDFGIEKVEFYIDNVLKESDYNYPYRHEWSIKEISSGSHKIKVIAYDAIQTAEDEITVNVVDSPPTVLMTAPGTTPLSGTVTIHVHAEDYKGVQSVTVYIDDKPLMPWAQGPQSEVDFNFELDTTAYSNGSHTLKAVAVDTANQESDPAEVRIIIENF